VSQDQQRKDFRATWHEMIEQLGAQAALRTVLDDPTRTRGRKAKA
jgi:hypothetical protein